MDANCGEWLGSVADGYALEWIDINDIRMVLLVERDKVLTNEKGGWAYRTNANALLNQIAGLIHDYHAFRLPLWRSAPTISLTADFLDTKRLRNVFADPLSFHPSQSDRSDCFFWPWQRCLSTTASQEVRYRPIATTSLVLDVRASTSAMEMTEPPDKFSEFIDSIVLAARTVILRLGGYFDKETGDGIVGHFCNPNNVPKPIQHTLSPPMEIIAVKAGQEIVQRVHELCLDYQRWLRHGMDKLGAAVGIHTGTAVWLADEMQVRAIGSSVVGASRLCGTADSGEIVISNHIYSHVDLLRGSVDGLLFKKKSIVLQEYGERVGAYAYAARVIP